MAQGKSRGVVCADRFRVSRLADNRNRADAGLRAGSGWLRRGAEMSSTGVLLGSLVVLAPPGAVWPRSGLASGLCARVARPMREIQGRLAEPSGRRSRR
jgi:hypothetical protein